MVESLAVLLVEMSVGLLVELTGVMSQVEKLAGKLVVE